MHKKYTLNNNNNYLHKKVTLSSVGLFIILLTSSFDIFGVLNIAGMTIRIPQIVTIFMFVFLAIENKIHISRSFIPLFIWLVSQLVFALFSSNRLYSVGYWGWTVIMVLMMIVFFSLINTKQKIEWLIKAYVLTFVIMSWIGIIQWILAFLGKPLFITQVTFNGTRIPRINGFTYEPSYYSTYLLPGWVLMMYLFENGSAVFSQKQTRSYSIVITIALFLSSSRMGWIFMVLYLAVRFIKTMKSSLVSKLKKRKALFIAICAVELLGVAVITAYLISKYGYDFIVAGLGISGTAAHSSGTRIFQFYNTLQLFLDSPFLGYSLGGVPVAYCEKYHIVPFDSGATMCVWIELLAASGIIGIIPFVTWIRSIFKGYRKSKINHSSLNIESGGLLYAFIFECMILALNQNILRIYFWILLVIMIIVERKRIPKIAFD